MLPDAVTWLIVALIIGVVPSAAKTVPQTTASLTTAVHATRPLRALVVVGVAPPPPLPHPVKAKENLS